MIGILPRHLVVGCVNRKIRTDFRVVLTVFEALEDQEITDRQRAFVCLRSIYYDYEDIPPEQMQEAIEKAVWFMDGGNAPKVKSGNVKSFDWKHDESILFPAVNKVAGFETRSCKYLHWWTFIGFFNEINDGLFATVMSIRAKRQNGKKLDDWEKEFYRSHAELINIYTEEEKRELEENERMLNEILGITA